MCAASAKRTSEAQAAACRRAGEGGPRAATTSRIESGYTIVELSLSRRRYQVDRRRILSGPSNASSDNAWGSLGHR
jgi:hypothetical protein